MRGRHADRSAPEAHSTRNGPDRRLIGGAVAAVISLLLFTNGLGTWSFWQSEVIVPGGTISSGSVDMSGTLEVQLLSLQNVGKRKYESTMACTPPSGYTECRVVSRTFPLPLVESTLAKERLIPGDTLRIVRSIKLVGEGDNLKGNLTIDAAGLLGKGEPGTSAFANSAAISMLVTKPGSPPTNNAELTRSFLVGHGQGDAFGTYTVVVTIETPPIETLPGSSTTRWNERLQGEKLIRGELTANFTQTP